MLCFSGWSLFPLALTLNTWCQLGCVLSGACPPAAPSAVTYVLMGPRLAAGPALGPEENRLGSSGQEGTLLRRQPVLTRPLVPVSRLSVCLWTSVLGWRRRWTSARWMWSPARGRTSRPGGAASPSLPMSDSAC